MRFPRRCPGGAPRSYRAWQAKGRQVRRGETAIRVLGPVTQRVQKLDQLGNPVRDADGKPVTGVRIVAVKPVSVFDVSQTDGDPLPEPPQPSLLPGEVPPGLWDALQRTVWTPRSTRSTTWPAGHTRPSSRTDRVSRRS